MQEVCSNCVFLYTKSSLQTTSLQAAFLVIRNKQTYIKRKDVARMRQKE